MRRRLVRSWGLFGLGLVSWITPWGSGTSCAAGSAAGAEPVERAPLRLPHVMVMRWKEGINIHIGNQEGAINRRGNVLVSVELLTGNKLRGSSSGTRSEHNLYSNYSTNEEATWQSRWSGTWVLTGSSLQLDLRQDAHECKKTKTATGAAPEKLKCRTPSPKLKMECSTQQIDLESFTGPPEAQERKVSKQEVWICSPDDSAELGETPSRWVLPRDISCVQVNPGIGPGRGGPTYRVCPPLIRGR